MPLVVGCPLSSTKSVGTGETTVIRIRKDKSERDASKVGLAFRVFTAGNEITRGERENKDGRKERKSEPDQRIPEYSSSLSVMLGKRKGFLLIHPCTGENSGSSYEYGCSSSITSNLIPFSHFASIPQKKRKRSSE